MLKTISINALAQSGAFGNLTVTDNVTTITNVTQITIKGGKISGNSTNVIIDQTSTTIPMFAPQGRLTLQSQFSTQGIDVSGATTIYYDSLYAGLVPVYDGANWNALQITNNEISMGLDAGVPHVAANTLYDVYAANNAGTLVIFAGPAWSNSSTVTMTLANPAVITWNNHNLPEGAPVTFTTTGSLPANVVSGTTYFVGRSPATNTFNISTSVVNASGGTFVSTLGESQSGVHTGNNATTGRNAGNSQIALINGIWTNGTILPHAWGGASGTTDYGPIPVNRATLLGTFLATANGQTSVIFKPNGVAGGSNNVIGLYNVYNQRHGYSYCRDNGTNFGLTSNAWRPFNPNGSGSGTNNRVTIVDGLATTYVKASTQTLIFTVGAGECDLGINQNSTNATPTGYSTNQTNGAGNTAITAQDINSFFPFLGVSYYQIMCNNAAATGNGSFNLSGQQNLIAEFDY